MDPLTLAATIAPALLPAISDALRGLVGKITGNAGAAPQNIAEVVQLQDADSRRLEALAKLDAPGGDVDKWVADLRGSIRDIVILLILVNYGGLAWVQALGGSVAADTLAQAGQMMGSAMFYLFGEHLYFNVKGSTWKR